MDLQMREATVADAPVLTDLSRQLGYPMTVRELEHNLAIILQHKNEQIFVACMDGMVIGWIHVVIRLTLESGSFAEICGLVVDQSARSKGIGAKLVESASGWCRSNGEQKLRLRTNRVRTEAHRFYERLGFREIKEQKVYLIEL